MIVIVKAVKNNYSHAVMLITGPEIKIKDWTNRPKLFYEYFDEIQGKDQKVHRYGFSNKINIKKSQSLTLRYLYQKYIEKYSSNSSANIISVKYSFN